MRLIDADALKDSLRESYEACQRWENDSKDEDTKTRAIVSRDTFLEAILRTNCMPTIKPEIVRCKDCGIGEKTLNVYRKGETWCYKQEKYHDDNWFCADGTPKEGGGHEES